jgi:hypothetical protein
MVELLIAVIAALVGAAVSWALGSGDRKQARQALSTQQALLATQQRVAELEAERSQREALTSFVPRTRVFAHGTDQFVRLEAAETFQVESMDYLNGTGAKFWSQSVDQTGISINIPLDQNRLTEIRNAGPWTNAWDHSAEASLRFDISKSGQPKQYAHKILLTQGVLNGTVYYTKVIG